MNYLITGFPGTGKSTIASELKKRGHVAYDPDKMKAYTHVESRETGRRIHPPLEKPAGWYDTIGALNWDPIKMSTLLGSNKDIFICSFAHNINDFYPLFKAVFVLTLDDTDLERRLLGRAGSFSIGKSRSELSDIMLLHRHFERSLLNKGAISLNAAQPVSLIVDKILEYCSETSSTT